MKVLITVNDMSPKAIPMWEKYWDKLKQRHPRLKVTVFTIPFLKEIPSNDIFKNKDFKTWYKTRSKWVEIAQQGYSNTKPPECTRFAKPQYAIIKRGYRKMMSYMPETIHTFMPPYNRMEKFTLPILQSLGFSCCVYHKTLILLKKADRPIEEFIIKETHINPDEKNPDNIQVIYPKLNKLITELKKKRYEFVTISELLKDCFIDEEMAQGKVEIHPHDKTLNKEEIIRQEGIIEDK